MFKMWMCVALLFWAGLEGVEFSKLKNIVAGIEAPYDWQIKLLKGRGEDERVLVLLHGMGGDNKIAEIIQGYGDVPDHLISFNFPDTGILNQQWDASKTSFGSIQEIMPLLYLLKKLVVDGGITSVNLYGFSAGGGALVNTISVLNGNNYQQELASLGIRASEKEAILNALQQGTLLLDAPLKSIEEIIATRGQDDFLDVLQKRYQKNGFEPIDALKNWQGLRMHVVVYFEKPDEILSNKDDNLFIDRLKSTGGKVEALEASYGGHISYHRILWKTYLR